MNETHGAVGSYVVNALDGPELDDFESHLAVCETCRREVVEFSETAAQLSSLVEVAPPPALRGAIMAAIAEVRPLPPEIPVDAPLSQHPPRRATWDIGPGAAAPVDELAQRRRRRTTRLLTLAVAAAMVVALALGGWAFNLVQARQSVVAESTLETQLYNAPDAKIYHDTMPDGTKVSFVASKSLNQALFVGPDLPSPGQGKTYQLWRATDKSVVLPDGTFSGGANRTAWFTGSIRDAAGLAVTIEPSGGSSHPTPPIRAQVTL